MSVSVLRSKNNEGESPEVPDIDRTEIQSFYHPGVLGVAIPVLVRPQGMSDTLNRINDRTGEIVSGIDLPPLAMVYHELGQGKWKFGNTHPVRWWGRTLHLYITGSRIALLGLSTLILARIHHLRPSSVADFISSKCFKLSSTELSLRFEAIPSMRSSRICRRSVSCHISQCAQLTCICSVSSAYAFPSLISLMARSYRVSK